MSALAAVLVAAAAAATPPSILGVTLGQPLPFPNCESHKLPGFGVSETCWQKDANFEERAEIRKPSNQHYPSFPSRISSSR
jgi:hypothetical protein